MEDLVYELMRLFWLMVVGFSGCLIYGFFVARSQRSPWK